jgi:hypothetical protein
MGTRKLGWSFTVAALLTALGLYLGRPAVSVSQAAKAPALNRPEAGSSAVLVGSGGCSARACHGSVEPLGERIQRNEYTKWLIRDKHAEAYQVLRDDPRSAQIVKHLGGKKPAYEDERCLACHTNPLAARIADSPLVQKERSYYGIGCEACHGAAEIWLGPHTTKGYSAERKRADGMTVLEDSAQLARRCAGCHVGAAPDKGSGMLLRDVNHDLIAAGHPRLNFEFAASRANLPPHWNEKAPRKRSEAEKQSEAEDWLVGQVVCASTALKLLDYRADPKNVTDPKNPLPWPEFAEYDCFACHHDLSEPSGRQTRGYPPGRVPGSPPWSKWYYAMPKALAKHGQQVKLSALGELEALMSQSYPDPAKVRSAAQAADEQLQSLLAKKEFKPGDAQKLLIFLAEQGQASAGHSWDQDAQLYLALAALDQANRDDTKQNQPVGAAFRDLSQALAFLPVRDNVHYDSPRDGSQYGEKFREALKTLVNQQHK